MSAVIEHLLDAHNVVAYGMEEGFALAFHANQWPLCPESVALKQEVAASAVSCQCGHPGCTCDCLPGDYPCEHGTLGEGCGQ